jgi:hypothetical protein
MDSTLDKTDTALLRRDAVISSDGLYRYRLGREWDVSLPRLTFIMLNPSTADATLDDPTIRRCMGFAKREGKGGIYVYNLYAFRATKPTDMLNAADPVGPENNRMLEEAFGYAITTHTPLVAAWGANARQDRVLDVLEMAEQSYAQLSSFGVTKHGHPKHPLYLPGDAELELWPR